MNLIDNVELKKVDRKIYILFDSIYKNFKGRG